MFNKTKTHLMVSLFYIRNFIPRGTARSAYIEGYRVGGKTGTAQIALNGSYIPNKYILSFLGIAPMNDPQVVAYIAIKEPNNYIQYGGVVVAPIVKELIFESLTLLNIPKQEGGIPRDSRWWVDSFRYKVDNYVGKKVTKFFHPNYKIKVIGTGDIIIAQSPEAGEVIVQDNYVYLYTN